METTDDYTRVGYYPISFVGTLNYRLRAISVINESSVAGYSTWDILFRGGNESKFYFWVLKDGAIFDTTATTYTNIDIITISV